MRRTCYLLVLAVYVLAALPGAAQSIVSYTPDDIRSISAETFLERMAQPDQFAAMNALARKAKESDAASRRSILTLVIAAMQDKSRPLFQRWQCCYVISGSGDERGVPDLIQVLLRDESEIMRAVAAEALADFPKSAAAHDALLQSARQETSARVREVLTRRLGQEMPASTPGSAPAVARAVDEKAPSGPPEPPAGPARPVAKPLPWPFPGDYQAQKIFNNYQQATDGYIHCGLDFIHPAGTPVTAVGAGYVACIYTNYPDWVTHHFFIVTPTKGGNRGWCYTHLDPNTFTFKEGDFIRQGQVLGSLVDFSVGNQPGVAHLHIHYVAFNRETSGKVNVRSLLDPLYFFDWKDTEPPVLRPLRFVSAVSSQQFEADAAGVVTVSGKVDVLAAITDCAYQNHAGNLGAPVVMLSISDGTHTTQKLVLDHRGDVGDEKQTKPLYLSYEEKKAFFNPDSFPRYQMLRVTKTDGDGRITPRDADECWDTTARDRAGKPVWPDGQYSVNVYAWDIAGNRAVAGATVHVKNGSSAGESDSKSAPTRGIAVIASDIGHDYSVDYLSDFVSWGRFSFVVVDWAWITHHWDRTDFAQVNRLLGKLSAQGVQVAAMYRPRFLSNPTVATQVGADGNPGVDHVEICYSDPSARKWGVAWGEKIIEKCPGFKEVIIYNPLNSCRCPKCTAAAASGPYAAVTGFLSEAGSAWRAKQSGVKLGLVSMPVPEFWKANLAVADVAHPYLCIKEDVDPAREVANIQAVRPIIKEKMGSCLGKITWEEGAKVSIEKLKTVDDLAAKAGIPYFFWTFDTLFKSSLYDPKAVSRALGIGQPAAGPAPSASPPAAQSTAKPAEPLKAPDAAKRRWARALLEKVQNAERGATQFAAINALAKKAGESNAVDRNAILWVAIATMKDTRLPAPDRWPCCYVVGSSGDKRGVPYLIQALLHDELDIMRSVAAEALGGLPTNTEAYDALRQAAQKDPSQMVRDVIAKYLGKAMPAPDPGFVPPAPNSAGGVQELAPSGPPEPPPGPARPVAKPLPWPFPGDYKAQNVFNNYQTCTDAYIHLGLDLIHPAGTPVTAVGPGYVAGISSNPPHTHDCFVVATAKGSDRGWAYTHMDPRTWTFKEGDFIQQGQVLGKLVKFAVDGKPGMDHLHLSYATFSIDASGKPNAHALLDPLYFFDWKDTEPPSFLPPRFVSEGADDKQFKPDASGVVTVKGKVDILAAITDSSHAGQTALFGVPVVMFSISDGTHTMQKLVLDHRGDVGDWKQTEPMYVRRDETRKMFNTSFHPYYQTLRVTKTDGDGIITPRDAAECWDTTAMDAGGKRLWPDGRYSVNVYAWDIAGNRGVIGAMVEVRNGQ
ncbi:MAG: peptidoglycan DD-metalloendopeptidase family protein [Armatimonadota bacterium]|nr:peptidoglycan DD-metalloendopeptidase family protein [Armatimonadota bacterium]